MLTCLNNFSCQKWHLQIVKLQCLENKNFNALRVHGVYFSFKKTNFGGFPGGAVVESLPADAGDAGSSPGLGGSHMPRSN